MKSRIATVMMTATVIDDLINWTLYAIILGSVTTAGSSSDRGLALDLLLVALLFVVVLVGVRWLAPHMVNFARRHLAWPSGYVAVVAVTVIAVSAVSEAIGVHAFLGAFLAGVAFRGVASGVGATGHKSLSHVAVGFFAPLFFVSMPEVRAGAPVVEASAGLPGEASLEAAIRFSLAGTAGPTVVGLPAKSKFGAPYRTALDRLAGMGRPGRIEESALDTIEGAAVTVDAPLVVRPFSAPEGLEPIERARPDAERFGCPVVLVSPDPDRTERASLSTLLDSVESTLPASID